MYIGKYTHGNPNVYRESNNDDVELLIGNFCYISENVNIYLGGNDRRYWVTSYPFGNIHTDTFDNYDWISNSSTNKDVTIGSDVWIGSNVTIMPGVTVGDGAVILNNSYIVTNVAPYTLVMGNPAKFVKYRFNPEQIEKLLIIKWWEWDDDKINQYIPLLCNSNIDNFIDSFFLSSRV